MLYFMMIDEICRVLVLGGSGGIGTFAVQVYEALGISLQ